MDLAFPASAHVPDALMSSLPVSIYFTPTGTWGGRDSRAHSTYWATEAHGDGASNPSHTASEGRVRI